MNKQRRKNIFEAINMIINAKEELSKAKDILDDAGYEEQEAFDNLSEGLQQTMRGEQMEDNATILQDTVEKLEDVLSDLDSIA